MAETRKCRWTGKEFVITDEDIAFYKKIGVPLPTLCPEERQRRRIVWRNERFLYKRKCALCSKDMISMYSKESTFPVLCEPCYWSDCWNALDYGRDYDFSKPFFEQFKELQESVPRLTISHANCENSDYTLNCVENKNCYLTSGADRNEDCMYGVNTQRSKDCVDHHLLYDSQLCYGCIDSSNLYKCVGCQECENCTDCWFLFDCKNCQNCAFSSNLRHKEYVIFNKQVTKEEYERQMQEIQKKIFTNPNWLEKNLCTVRENAIHKESYIINSENVSGNYIKNSKNSIEIYDSELLEDCKYVHYALNVKDSYDLSSIGFKCSLLYEIISGAYIYNCRFSNFILNSSNLQYCINVSNSNNCFGSISLKDHKQYIILNKQYSKEKYEALLPRIIEHMKKTGEYGEFFPPSLSPFEYNRCMTIDRMPLSKEEALQRGMKWFDGKETQAEGSDIKAMTCKKCNKQYRPIKQELDYYQKMELPAPKHCWPCRLVKLLGARKPQKLFNNTCKNCNKNIRTPIQQDRPEKVFCEECYLATVY